MKTIKRLCMMLAVLFCLAVPVQADAIIEENHDITVDYYVKVSASDGGANFRYGAGVEYDKLISNMIPNGTVLHIVGERTANTGRKWGYTEYQGMWGYVSLSQTSPCASPEEEAAKEEALRKEAKEQEAAEKAAAETAEQEALRKEAEEQKVPEEEAAEQESLEKEAEGQEVLEKEAAEQEALEKEETEQETLEKEAAEQETLENETESQNESENESQNSGMDTGFLIKILVIVGICVIAAVTAGFLIIHYKRQK